MTKKTQKPVVKDPADITAMREEVEKRYKSFKELVLSVSSLGYEVIVQRNNTIVLKKTDIVGEVYREPAPATETE